MYIYILYIHRLSSQVSPILYSICHLSWRSALCFLCRCNLLVCFSVISKCYHLVQSFIWRDQWDNLMNQTDTLLSFLLNIFLWTKDNKQERLHWKNSNEQYDHPLLTSSIRTQANSGRCIKHWWHCDWHHRTPSYRGNVHLSPLMSLRGIILSLPSAKVFWQGPGCKVFNMEYTTGSMLCHHRHSPWSTCALAPHIHLTI